MTTRLSLLLRALLVGAVVLAWCSLAFVARADEPSCGDYAGPRGSYLQTQGYLLKQEQGSPA